MTKAKRDQKYKKFVTVQSKISKGCSKKSSCFFFYIKKNSIFTDIIGPKFPQKPTQVYTQALS